MKKTASSPLEAILNVHSLDLWVVGLGAAIAGMSTLSLPASHPMRVLFTLPLLLYYPGHAAVAGLWPGRTKLPDSERLVLGVGVSLAILVLCSLLLVFSPWGLTTAGIASALISVTIALCVVAGARRRKLPKDEAVRWSQWHWKPPEVKGGLPTMVTILLVLSAVAAIGSAVYLVAMGPGGEGYSELLLLSENRTVGDYPTNLVIGENGTVVLQVQNHLGHQESYSLEARLLNETGARSNRSLATWDLSLTSEETWEAPFTFSVSEDGVYRLLFSLRNSRGELLEVHLWVQVTIP